MSHLFINLSICLPFSLSDCLFPSLFLLIVTTQTHKCLLAAQAPLFLSHSAFHYVAYCNCGFIWGRKRAKVCFYYWLWYYCCCHRRCSISRRSNSNLWRYLAGPATVGMADWKSCWKWNTRKREENRTEIDNGNVECGCEWECVGYIITTVALLTRFPTWNEQASVRRQKLIDNGNSKSSNNDDNNNEKENDNDNNSNNNSNWYSAPVSSETGKVWRLKGYGKGKQSC